MKTHKAAPRAIAAILSLASFPTFLSAADHPRTLKIGVQLPLTGERADVGKLMQNGLQMALDKINAGAGKNGPKWELVWADDESSTDAALKALDKLVHDPQVIAIAGEINSPFVLASAPVIDKEGVPYLTGGTSPRTTAQSQWIFRVGASDALLTDLLTGYVVDTLKLKNVAVLHDKTGIHNARADLIATSLKDKHGAAPVVNATWSPGDRDFAALLEQVKASHAQAIVALGETSEGGAFFKQVKTSGVQAQVIAHRDFGAKVVLDQAGDAAQGALIFTEYSPQLQGSATQTWAAAYKTRFGTDANVIAAQYYDSLLLLAEAMKKGGPTRAGVKTGLQQLKAFRGAMADYTFDAGRNGVHRFFVAKVTSGRLTLVETLNEAPPQK